MHLDFSEKRKSKYINYKIYKSGYSTMPIRDYQMGKMICLGSTITTDYQRLMDITNQGTGTIIK